MGTPTDSGTGLSLTAAAVNEMGFEWHCQEGLLANMGKVVQEYRVARGLEPLRLLVHGNDDLAKAALAEAISTEYKLPLVRVCSHPSSTLMLYRHTPPRLAPAPSLLFSHRTRIRRPDPDFVFQLWPGPELSCNAHSHPPTHSYIHIRTRIRHPHPFATHLLYIPCNPQASTAIQKAAAAEDELGTELKTATAAGSVSDALTMRVLSAALTVTECRNQGYVLEGFPETLSHASSLFPAAAVTDGEEAPPEEEGEEGSGGSKKLVPAAPEFVVSLEAADEVVKQKMLAQSDSTVTEEQLGEKLAAYATNNAEDSPTSLLAMPALASIEALPLEVQVETTTNALASKVRVYLGAPRNYGPSKEELAAKAALETQAAKRKEAEESKLKGERDAAEVQERQQREAVESRRLAELQQKERELLEVRSIPLRNYLMQNVIPTLTEGLIEVCKLKPEDPVDYLAEWLFKNNPVEEELFD